MNTKLLEMDPATYRLEIALAIQMVYIIDIDVATQTLQALIELQLKWQDQRLAWDPEKYDDLESLYVSCESLWAPEEFLVSAPTVTEVIPDRFKQCIIYSNRTVGYDLMLRIENSCAMNVRKFPFDTQSCAIFFTSNQYDWYQVLLLPTAFTKYHDSTFDRMGNGEWSFVNTSFEVTYDEKENFQIASFVLTCKREPAFYIYVITLPCFLLTFLSITGCFWTKNVREEQLTKLSIALTSMMSMTTFVDMVSQQMPKTSEFPLLGIFVLTCVFITSISCVVLVVFPEKRNPRENKPWNSGTLVQRIHERYFDENEYTCEFIMSSSPSKLLPRGLEIVVLNHMQIRDVGDGEQLDKYMKHVQDLDLAWNDIQDWNQISELCSHLPVLRSLNLSFNPLKKSIDLSLPKMNRVNTLILNGTKLPLSSVRTIASACPSLQELHLSHNEFSPDDPSTSAEPMSSPVQTIHLNHCGLKDWDHVMRILTLFPNKQIVYLSENPISRIRNGEEHSDPAKHNSLRALTLSKTEIRDWESIDHLENFPGLQEIRLTNTPVLESYSDEEKVHLVTARLQKIKVLNGSNITDSQRESSERFFIRYFQDREDKPNHYQRLVDKHGTLEKLAKVDLTPKPTVSVRIVCEETDYEGTITAPVNRTIAQFMRFLEKITGIQAARMRIFHQCEEGFPSEVRLSNQPFHSLHPEDGDTFLVQSKMLPSRKRAQATKSESSDHEVDPNASHLQH
ncbi:unnamed protein product, partial [Mesorhabditis belari]|uniref:Uncharacterized protein n=1 Tax=Mesorhabditis belari TaxID=2138241 RepID=A0AAF3EH57_9BILA